MRNLMITLLLGLTAITSYACPVCERNKPKILQGITHGSNPESNWDYVIVFAIIIIAILTLFYSVKWLIKPNENNPNHIKYTFLNEQ
jgi:hypothetical protein